MLETFNAPRSLCLKDPYLKSLSFRGNRAKFKSLSFRGNRAKFLKPLNVLFIANKTLRFYSG